MSEKLKDAFDGLILLAIVLSLFFLSGLAQAGNATNNLAPGQRVLYTCQGGKMVVSTSETSAEWRCVASGGPTQPPDPPVEPDPPATGCQPASAKQLADGQEIFSLSNNRITMRKFNSRIFANGGTISFGEFSGTGMDIATVVVSLCPNDVDVSGKSRDCWRAGNQSSLKVSSRGTGRGICGLAPNTTYYVNIKPEHPGTGRPGCSGSCQIVLFSSNN